MACDWLPCLNSSQFSPPHDRCGPRVRYDRSGLNQHDNNDPHCRCAPNNRHARCVSFSKDFLFPSSLEDGQQLVGLVRVLWRPGFRAGGFFAPGGHGGRRLKTRIFEDRPTSWRLNRHAREGCVRGTSSKKKKHQQATKRAFRASEFGGSCDASSNGFARSV